MTFYNWRRGVIWCVWFSLLLLLQFFFFSSTTYFYLHSLQLSLFSPFNHLVLDPTPHLFFYLNLRNKNLYPFWFNKYFSCYIIVFSFCCTFDFVYINHNTYIWINNCCLIRFYKWKYFMRLHNTVYVLLFRCRRWKQGTLDKIEEKGLFSFSLKFVYTKRGKEKHHR